VGTVRVRQTVIDKSQPEEIYQVVGFSEYDNALHHLDRFVSLSLPEELEVVDEILATRDEFSIYVNLSRRFDTGDSSLDQPPLHPQDDFKRQGLTWIMALARVERAAMLAGFTSVAIPLPLEGVRDAEKPVLAELLLDAIRSHYWSMYHNPRMALLSQGKATSRQAFVVGRRVVMLRTMINLLEDLAGDQFTPVQRSEMVRWSQSLNEVEQYAIRTVAKWYAQASRDDGLDYSSINIKTCPALQRGIMASLSRGEATVVPGR
jgi:hypothetical protein